MQQDKLRPPKNARRRVKRVGRGDGSGRGSYSGRGIKGQKARSGGGVRPGFEGGQLPLAKAMSTARGFTNIFRCHYYIVNLDQLASLPPATDVTPQALVERGLIKDLHRPLKVLGRGELAAALNVEAHQFSRQAREKIEAAGGKTRTIS